MMMELKADYFDNMLRAKKGYARIMDPICKEWNLTRNELDILLFLHNNPNYDRASDIVTRRGIAKSHVSMSVSSLEQRGLILRHTDPNDRRTIHLQLSETAHIIANTGRKAQVAFFTQLYEGLTAEEIAQWQGVIMKVSNNISKMKL